MTFVFDGLQVQIVKEIVQALVGNGYSFTFYNNFGLNVYIQETGGPIDGLAMDLIRSIARSENAQFREDSGYGSDR